MSRGENAMTHLQIAIDYTHATKINGKWRWYDDASCTTCETDAREMARLGAALQAGEPDAYSRWCAESHRIIEVSYGIVYGGEGRADVVVIGPFRRIEEARAAYNDSDRVRYMDGLIGGASIVTLDQDGCPTRTLETLAEDEVQAS